MARIICGDCRKVHEQDEDHCPHCGPGHENSYDFSNSDEYLERNVPKVLEERKQAGLEGLTGGLEYVVINTEPGRTEAAAGELVSRTGHRFSLAYEDGFERAIVLSQKGSAGLIVRSRRSFDEDLSALNDYPRSRSLPQTRLEALVFSVKDIDRYFDIQRKRGIRFKSGEVQRFDNYSYIETLPSEYTGNATGFIQWTGERGDFSSPGRKALDWDPGRDADPLTAGIGRLDHMATRVRAEDRDAAIIEFMRLTDYDFDFAIYVKVFNSITNVARLSPDEYAMVFTSGIRPFMSEEQSGPTEKFIHNYGPRVHHMAFDTAAIDETYERLRADGQDFLIELVGSESEGLKQTFTEASEHTLLVNEYIHRYGDFKGFFTKSNVTHLTGSTDRQ